jgi:hypothetical protein
MGSAMKKLGSVAEGVFATNDAAGVQAGAMGMPPTPEMGALATAGDALKLGKSAMKIAEPGPAPNSAWGDALISGGKIALSLFGESLMPGQGATMTGMVLDQALAAGDALLPGGSAGTVGNVFNQVTGLGGGPEQQPRRPPPRRKPAAAAPVAAPPVPVAPARGRRRPAGARLPQFTARRRRRGARASLALGSLHAPLGLLRGLDAPPDDGWLHLRAGRGAERGSDPHPREAAAASECALTSTRAVSDSGVEVARASTVGPLERFTTYEGEYAAVVTVETALAGGERLERTIALVAGDDLCAVIDGATARAAGAFAIYRDVNPPARRVVLPRARRAAPPPLRSTVPPTDGRAGAALRRAVVRARLPGERGLHQRLRRPPARLVAGRARRPSAHHREQERGHARRRAAGLRDQGAGARLARRRNPGRPPDPRRARARLEDTRFMYLAQLNTTEDAYEESALAFEMLLASIDPIPEARRPARAAPPSLARLGG